MFTACGITWDADDVERFLLDFCRASPTGCLEFTGAMSRGGAHRATGRKAGNKKWYGSFHVKGKTVRAHKFYAVAILGLRPGPGDELDHNCYNTRCVCCMECVPRAINQARIRRGRGVEYVADAQQCGTGGA